MSRSSLALVFRRLFRAQKAARALFLMPLSGLLVTPTSASADAPATPAVQAERSGGNFGAGLIIGDINGLSLKFWDGQAHGFQLRVGTSDLNSGDFSATYERHFRPVTVPDSNFSLPFYVGAGVRGKLQHIGRLYMEGGVEGVGGLSILTPNVPVEIFFEIRPKLVVFTNYTLSDPAQFWGGFQVEGGLGANYYF